MRFPMLCELCCKDYNVGDVLITKSRHIFVCKECQSFVLINGIRVQGGFMVVPVKYQSLEKAIKEHIYVRPWVRKTRHQAFIAFYHKGAIFYIGKIKRIDVKVPREKIEHMLQLDERWGKKDFYIVYEMQYVDMLKKPILKDKCPTIQSKVLVPFKKFVSAKNICDFFKRNRS